MMETWFRQTAASLVSLETRVRDSPSFKRYMSNVDTLSVSSDDSIEREKDGFRTLDARQPYWLQRSAYLLHSRNHRFWVIMVGTALFLLLLTFSGSAKPTIINDAYHSITKPMAAAYPREEHLFYILAPAGQMDLSMCKSMLTSSILQYPTMYYAHPDEKLKAAGHSRDRNFARLDSIRNFLRDLPARRDNDTMLVLDEPNSWFQLRPEVLLQRYLDMNAQANQQLEKAHGGAKALATIGIKQNIIFTAQDSCIPELKGSSICTAIPQKAPGYSHLGTGMHIGSVKALRALYEHACSRARGGTAWTSIHMLMTLIHGEQELQRQRFLSVRDHSSLPRKNSTTGLLPGEFSIGLDHQSLLSSSGSAAGDLALIRNSESLAEEILLSQPPFWTVSGDGSAGLPPDSTPWTEISLLTNTRTFAVPAIVHPDERASRDGWKQWWMAPHARRLLDRVLVEDSPAAIVLDEREGKGKGKGKGKGVEVRFWAPTWNKPGYNVWGDGGFRRWEEGECGTEEVAEGVFGDGEGPWKNPYL